MFRQRLFHDGGLARIILPHLGDVLVVKPGRQRAREKLLQQIRRAEIVVALDALDGRENRFRQNAEADSRAGRVGLAVSAGVDHALRRTGQREGGRHVRAVVKAQFAIRGVFEQIQRMAGGALVFLQQLQRGGLFRERSGRAGRVLKIGDKIKRLHAAQFAGFLQLLQNFFQMREVNAVAFELYAARFDAAALQDAQEDKIGRVFDENDVAFVAQRFQRHVKQLLRAAGDDDVLRRMRAVVSAVELLQVLGGERTQIHFSGGDAVLQRGLSGLGRAQDIVENLARNLHGQR